ncbi:LptE family protein [Candidatus Poribacteria bacterium]|nr:LptE family protein [Candidatus Poribacteria bacterium]
MAFAHNLRSLLRYHRVYWVGSSTKPNEPNKRNNLPIFGIIAFILLSLTLLGCGYVTKSNYLPHIKSIYIMPVENQSPLFEDEEALTEALRREFRKKWGPGGDSTLKVTIKEFKVEPISFDVNNFPEQYRMTLVIDYTFEDNVKKRIIDSKQDYVESHDFYVVQGRGVEPETEEEAKAKLIEELARDLYNNLAEQW